MVAVAWCAAASALCHAAGLDTERATLYANYAARLAKLAAECQQQQLATAAEELNAWLPARPADRLTLYVLPPTMAGEPATAEGASEPWRKQWQALRDAQADALMALAKRALSEHRPALAYELVIEAVRENADHKAARKLLGYVRFREAWHTPFEVRQLNAGKVWHDTFGWLPKAHVPRYERGERNYQGRWLSAEAEAALRQDVKRGWRVESDHYIVTTNHSLEEGVRLSRRLETLYAIWQQVFIGYLVGEGDLAKRFEGRASRREPRQHNVVYYRTRDEYIAALRPVQPKIDITIGIYLSETRTAYFFAGEEQEPGTLYHEATHQLFHEAAGVASEVARDRHFWIIEGIACYLATLSERADGWFSLGGRDAGRAPAARYRLLEDNFYVPLAEFVALGMQAVQHDPRIQQLYSQASGLADFFMHGQGGAYREPLVRYLDAIYHGRATTRTLAELTGASYETLDRQYRAFMSQPEAAADAAR